jgi:replicative DNA helicase
MRKDEIPPEVEGVAEIIIAKQRNGPTGSVKLAFLKNSTRFENMMEGPTSSEY